MQHLSNQPAVRSSRTASTMKRKDFSSLHLQHKRPRKPEKKTKDDIARHDLPPGVPQSGRLSDAELAAVPF